MKESDAVKKIEFNDVKDKLNKILTEKFNQQNLNPSDFLLVDSFINQPIQSALSGNIVLGGPTIPMVAVVNIKSGAIQFYALKVLLPELAL